MATERFREITTDQGVTYRVGDYDRDKTGVSPIEEIVINDKPAPLRTHFLFRKWVYLKWYKPNKVYLVRSRSLKNPEHIAVSVVSRNRVTDAAPL